MHTVFSKDTCKTLYTWVLHFHILARNLTTEQRVKEERVMRSSFRAAIVTVKHQIRHSKDREWASAVLSSFQHNLLKAFRK